MQVASIVARVTPAAMGDDIWFQPGLSVSEFDGGVVPIVYVAVATLLGERPVFQAFAFIVVVEETGIWAE